MASQFGELLSIVAGRFALTQNQQRLFLIDLKAGTAKWLASSWLTAWQRQEVKTLPLLIPQRLPLTKQALASYQEQGEKLASLGFELTLLDDTTLLIRKIPSLTQYYDSAELVLLLINSDIASDSSEEGLEKILRQMAPDHTKLDLSLVFTAIESARAGSKNTGTSCWREIGPADLKNLLGN